MAKGNIVLEGMDTLLRVLLRGSDAALDATRRGLYEEANIIFNKSARLVPFHYGTLAASGRVHDPVVQGRDVMVEITYGGPAASKNPKEGGEVYVGYAEIQHENTSFKHAPGRQAKYLESPVNDAAPTLGVKLSKRVDAILNGLI